MALPQYKYGQVTGLFPDLRVVSERSETPMVCCGYCSAHMACITAKAGLSNLMTNEAHAIRAKGGRPHNAGSRASELRAGAKAALGVTLLSVAIEDIPDRLRKGFAVEAAIQYADLPAWLKVQSNDFGHSVTLFGWDELYDRAGFFDPLWNQGARGAWAPWVAIKAALWANGNHNTTTVRLVPAGGGSDVTIQSHADVKTNDVANIIRDTDMCKTPGGTRVASAIKGRNYPYVGSALKEDGTGTGWRAIIVNTAKVYPDGLSRPTILYIKSADMTVVQGPDAPTPPVNTDCTDEVAIAIQLRDEQWREWLLGGSPGTP